mmetsp:Transcript_36156/g.113494  ORF Transcript_36156/g.113494 Transcript_36156/m.113494 type:complete len:280 (-) Transcript_36156:12-851(-)
MRTIIARSCSASSIFSWARWIVASWACFTTARSRRSSFTSACTVWSASWAAASLLFDRCASWRFRCASRLKPRIVMSSLCFVFRATCSCVAVSMTVSFSVRISATRTDCVDKLRCSARFSFLYLFWNVPHASQTTLTSSTCVMSPMLPAMLVSSVTVRPWLAFVCDSVLVLSLRSLTVSSAGRPWFASTGPEAAARARAALCAARVTGSELVRSLRASNSSSMAAKLFNMLSPRYKSIRDTPPTTAARPLRRPAAPLPPTPVAPPPQCATRGIGRAKLG